MNKYRKKPVVIEAMQYESCVDGERIIKWAGENGLNISFKTEIRSCNSNDIHREYDYNLLVHTLEGTMTADMGDWIIKGVNNEFYPCKPDIFEKTYEPVDDAEQKEKSRATIVPHLHGEVIVPYAMSTGVSEDGLELRFAARTADPNTVVYVKGQGVMLMDSVVSTIHSSIRGKACYVSMPDSDWASLVKSSERIWDAYAAYKGTDSAIISVQRKNLNDAVRNDIMDYLGIK